MNTCTDIGESGGRDEDGAVVSSTGIRNMAQVLLLTKQMYQHSITKNREAGVRLIGLVLNRACERQLEEALHCMHSQALSKSTHEFDISSHQSSEQSILKGNLCEDYKESQHKLSQYADMLHKLVTLQY